ncbi:hypothetical protein SAMN02799631_03239 [Methylobacterium sp. 174MFSha1.1]|uniref:hypothetical protein n=1 Tax=Methylobacterium sp. 174MFSha1.1 TaxID=1502749 RepID=UPI0008F383B2|nr:hypothetical protein [Methylobacterium sp. 174MFSha1.1]SFU93400.1 hypothetical protein SAMN02799631_03239 [Methylobacterium sp. 174MFSha1.1]
MTPGDEAFLLTLAGLLREGLDAEPVPAYRAEDLVWLPGLPAWKRRIALAAR